MTKKEALQLVEEEKKKQAKDFIINLVEIYATFKATVLGMMKGPKDVISPAGLLFLEDQINQLAEKYGVKVK